MIFRPIVFDGRNCRKKIFFPHFEYSEQIKNKYSPLNVKRALMINNEFFTFSIMKTQIVSAENDIFCVAFRKQQISMRTLVFTDQKMPSSSRGRGVPSVFPLDPLCYSIKGHLFALYFHYSSTTDAIEASNPVIKY